MIRPEDISDDRDRGLVVLAYSRTVAPCLEDLTDPVRIEQAVAILRGVAADMPAAGARRVAGQSRNGTSVTFRDVSSAFTLDDRAALRALCGLPVNSLPATPIGSFPASGLVSEIWPERA